MTVDRTMLDAKIAEYRDALRTVGVAVALLRQHDYTQLLCDIEHADAFGPLLDPTLWRDKQTVMNEDRKVFEAARAFVGAMRPK